MNSPGEHATDTPNDLTLPAEAGATNHWWANVQSSLRASQFRARITEAGTIALSNRDQRLRAEVELNGAISIRARPESAVLKGATPDFELSLRTEAYGRPGALVALPASSPRLGDCDGSERVDIDGNCLHRTEIVRKGVIEWWTNDARGLEQGWTINSPPPGEGPLVVDVEVQGLEVLVNGDGSEAQFGGSGSSLRYSHLVAWDTTGRHLAARMERSNLGLRIQVDDSDAHYPVTIDPLLGGNSTIANAFWSTTNVGNQINTRLGFSVAGAGDLNLDGFDDIIVGAPYYEHVSNRANEGGAFVFLGSSTGPSTTPDAVLYPNYGGAHFGWSVDGAGDINGDGYADIVVGAPDHSSGKGYIAVYLGSAQVAQGVAGAPSSPDWSRIGLNPVSSLGRSVAGLGDVNGDGYSDIASTSESPNRIVVYPGSPTGIVETAGNYMPQGSSWAVNLEGESEFVTGVGDVNGDGFADLLTGQEGAASLFLGYAAIFDCDTDGDGESDAPQCPGLSYPCPTCPTLNPDRDWTVTSTAPGFGAAVGGAGDVDGDGYADILIGDMRVEPTDDAGSAILYAGGQSGPSSTPSWTVSSPQTGSDFGVSVSSAGDVNGDGYGDVVVGASGHDNGQVNEGRAYLYLGSSSGLSSTHAWRGESGIAGARFGNSVSSAGDVNGDGYSDVLVGAYLGDYNSAPPAGGDGYAYIYLGAPSIVSETPTWTDESDQASSSFGYSLGTAGDVNGDGFDDVVVGAYEYDNGQNDEGQVFLYEGTASGLASEPSWTAEGNQAGAQFGWAVDGAGDINGDGYADVVIGAPKYDNGQSNEGRAFVYHGSATGLSPTAAWTAEADQVGAELGFAVDSAGDVNGDGFDDLIVGAHLWRNAENDSVGKAYLYLGGLDGLDATPGWSTAAGEAGARYGSAVAGAGDVNGDGFSDILVGAHLHDNPFLNLVDCGAVSLFHGSDSGPGTTENSFTFGLDPNDHLGSTVAGPGDVDGDGYDDVFLVAKNRSFSTFPNGSAWIYSGSPTGVTFDYTGLRWYSFVSGVKTISSVGDVNLDGFGDWLIGRPEQTVGPQPGAGSASLYLGVPHVDGELWEPIEDTFVLTGDQPDAALGRALTGGDFNGDGYADFVVGAPGYDGAETDNGKLFVHLGNGGDETGASANNYRPQARSPGSATPIAPGLWSGINGGLDIAVDGARSAFGRSGVRLAVEAKPRGDAFEWSYYGLCIDSCDGFYDGLAVSSFSDSGLDGAALTAGLSNLSSTTGYHWRARLEFAPTAAFATGRTPWLYGGDSGSRLGDHVFVKAYSEPPVAVADVATVNEGGSTVVLVLDNDTDDLSTLLYTGVSIQTSPTYGTVVVDTNGVIYTHDDSETTSDSFTYLVNDGVHDSNIVSVSITIDPVNDGPVAVDDSATVDEGALYSIPVLSNDSDVDDTLLYSNVSLQSFPANGTAVVDSSGISYTHDGSEDTSSDTFTYQVSDGDLNSDTATVSITINSVNDPPTAVADAATVVPSGIVVIDVLANDTDPDSTLSNSNITLKSNPLNGTAFADSNGVTYSHNGGFSASDSFTYSVSDGEASSNTVTISITISSSNSTPVAVADSATVDEGSSVQVAVLANDTDDSTLVYGNVSIVSAPTNGTAVVASSGVTYSHDGSETTSDSFTYRVSDGSLNSNTATVTIAVTPINDAPVATNDSTVVAPGDSQLVDVLANDTDPDSTLVYGNVTIRRPPNNGTVSIGNNGITYTHNDDLSVEDSFTYRVSDGQLSSSETTVTVFVVSTNQPPVAVADSATVNEGATAQIDVLANDSDPDSALNYDNITVQSAPSNGTAVVDNESVTYVHDGSETTSDSFTYSVSDGELDSNTVTVSVTVNPVNDAPVASSDVATVVQGASVVVTVLDNDTDVDSTLSYSNVSVRSEPRNGSVVAGSGGITYTHDGSETTSDTFSYSVSDGFLDSNPVIVSITVTPSNAAPVAADDSATVDEAASVEVDVLANDTDSDSPLLYSNVSVQSSPTNGTVIVDTEGILYSHNGSETTSDSFTYNVSDGELVSNTATVTITVRAVNNAPVAAGDTATVDEGASVVVAVLSNDSDVDSALVYGNVTVLGSPTNGTAVVSSTG
ncbi:MAG: hypothetical protein CL928_17395, partial [Deltaproteobacteria bacterium]|nr:hypothetical protein [Deltaproteobacteria bacterium]